MSAFLTEILPELKAQSNEATKVSFLWDTKPMSAIDVPALAMQSFGHEVSDESKYTYRTLRYGLNGGEAKCLVIYDAPQSRQPATTDLVTTAPNHPSKAGVLKWYQFWK